MSRLSITLSFCLMGIASKVYTRFSIVFLLFTDQSLK